MDCICKFKCYQNFNIKLSIYIYSRPSIKWKWNLLGRIKEIFSSTTTILHYLYFYLHCTFFNFYIYRFWCTPKCYCIAYYRNYLYLNITLCHKDCIFLCYPCYPQLFFGQTRGNNPHRCRAAAPLTSSSRGMKYLNATLLMVLIYFSPESRTERRNYCVSSRVIKFCFGSNEKLPHLFDVQLDIFEQQGFKI